MVDEKRRTILWDKYAKNQFRIAYNKIYQESISGADKFRSEVIKCIDQIPEHPYRYPADRYKLNHQGDYRAFEIYNYRIVYKITTENILILRLRHVKREPLNY